jgi:hypothetical protein
MKAAKAKEKYEKDIAAYHAKGKNEAGNKVPAGQQAQRRRMNQKMRKRRKKMKNKWLSYNDACGMCMCAQGTVLLRM